MSDLGTPRRTEQKKHSENWVQREDKIMGVEQTGFYSGLLQALLVTLNNSVIKGMTAVRGHKCPVRCLSL